jgi:hypothetical protein
MGYIPERSSKSGSRTKPRFYISVVTILSFVRQERSPFAFLLNSIPSLHTILRRVCYIRSINRSRIKQNSGSLISTPYLIDCSQTPLGGLQIREHIDLQQSKPSNKGPHNAEEGLVRRLPVPIPMVCDRAIEDKP